MKLGQTGFTLGSSERKTWHESGSNCGTRNTRELVIVRLHLAGIEMSAGVLLASSFYSLCFMHIADFQGSLFPSLLNCF